MNKDDMVKYLLIAGGAYAVYWYITSNGPYGPVYNAAGQKIAPSYWDSWFGTATAPVATAPPPASTTLVPVATAPGIAPGSATPPAQQPAVSPSVSMAQLRSALLQASGGDQTISTSSFLLNADQWNYYRNNLQPPALTPDQFGRVIASLPAGVSRDSMNVDQFLSALSASGVVGMSGMGYGMGMGDVVPVMSRPSVPMMSFGGAGFNPFPQKKGWTN